MRKRLRYMPVAVATVLMGSLVTAAGGTAGANTDTVASAERAEHVQLTSVELATKINAASFSQFAKEFALLHEAELITGGKTTSDDGAGSPVSVNADLARAQGFSAETILLASESASLSNQLIAELSAQRPGVTESAVTSTSIASTYPALNALFNAASAADSAAAQPEILGPGGRLLCGFYPNPKPSKAAQWKTYERNNPAKVLRDLGYHETPDLAGGGWTRPQTWRPVACGISTFRDHALITGKKTLKEQNYKGEPPGEPNPEVYRSGPWPYPDWPAYVLWWHRTF